MGELVGGRFAVFCGFAAAGFAEAEDGAAVDGEVLFALAGGGIGTADEGADDVEEVAIGPVVSFEQRPEGDDGDVELAVGPGAGVFGGKGVAELEPFG